MACSVALQALPEDAGRVLREILPCSATDEAWRLLSSYLERYPSQNSLYHRCVINKLLAHGIPLPNWLINSYKVRPGTASLHSVPPLLLCATSQPWDCVRGCVSVQRLRRASWALCRQWMLPSCCVST